MLKETRVRRDSMVRKDSGALSGVKDSEALLVLPRRASTKEWTTRTVSVFTISTILPLSDFNEDYYLR